MLRGRAAIVATEHDELNQRFGLVHITLRPATSFGFEAERRPSLVVARKECKEEENAKDVNTMEVDIATR